MKQLKSKLKDGMGIFAESHKVYRKLQKHLDKQPVGFPATASGVERRLLRDAFTVDEAAVALEMSYKFLSFEKIPRIIKSVFKLNSAPDVCKLRPTDIRHKFPLRNT